MNPLTAASSSELEEDTPDGKVSRKAESHTKRNVCRTLKMLIFVLCLTGFGYQTTEFLTNFYTYPTVISIDVTRMDQVPTPALTFCSKYWFNFTKYCEMHPMNCEKPKNITSFCRDQPTKCKENKTDVVTPKDFPTIRVAKDWEALKDIFFNASDAFDNIDPEYFKGPFLLFNSKSEFEVCFRADNGYAQYGLRKTPKEGSRTYRWKSFYVNFGQSEKIFYSPQFEPYGTLYIHSPLLSFKKSVKSVVLRTHMRYNIFIRLEQECLLPFPYTSDCVDYEELWRKNNKTGPASREMCEYMCEENDDSEELYFQEIIDRTYEEEWCISILERQSSAYEVGLNICKCRKNCKDECLKLNYDFSFVEHKGMWVDEISFPDDRRTYVNLIMEKDNVRALSYKPQYMDVEVFSYIGGFLGCWLGISLWTSSGILWKGFSGLRSYVKEYRKSLWRSSKNISNEP